MITNDFKSGVSVPVDFIACGGGGMSEAHKSECRSGERQNAKQNTNAANSTPAQTIGNPDKAFATLAARYALMGHSLARTDPTDGPATYYAGRWGLVRELPTLGDARRFLLQIGGVL